MQPRVALLVALLAVAGVGATPVAASADETATNCTFPVTSTDATGTEVTVQQPPERVVALGPSAAQTMWDIGGQQQVVGMPVNQYTDYLPGYDERENVMNPDGFTINIEQVVNLTPDLVLAPNVIRDDTVATLREAGLTVYKFGFAADLDDVTEKTRLTGRLTGHCDGADDRVAWMEDRLDAVRQAVEGEPRPAVIYPLGGGFVAGKGTFLHEIILAAGGRNVAAEANITGYAKISVEVIVTRDPEWLILNEGLPRSGIQMYAYNHTTAGRQEQIIRVNPNYANQPGPRVVLAVETIVKGLHPEAYEAANSTATATPPATATPTPSPTPTEPLPATETPGQSGFGVLVALIALLLASIVARHW